MMRWPTVIWVVLAIVAGTSLYLVKYRVHDLEARLVELDRATARDREAIHVLEAEWSYVTRPARLADLGRRFLALEPLRQAQTITINDLSHRTDANRRDRGTADPAEDLPPDIDAWLTRLMASLKEPR